MSFLLDYFNITDSKTEVQVTCPFPHTTVNGLTYYESNPSASVNTEKMLFHCMSCGEGLSETQFIEKVLDTGLIQAKRIQAAFNTEDDELTWSRETLEPETLQYCKNLGISEAVTKELQLKTTELNLQSVDFPVLMYGKLLDVRSYCKGGTPKVKGRQGSPTGLIIPYDLWEASSLKHTTIICAGEKDMAVARSHGLNAITLTGGEMAAPLFLAPFKNRNIVICYDNDDAGRQGAAKLGTKLLGVAKTVRVCTEFHKGMENKEDITDYFVKYKHTKEDLVHCIKATPLFTPPEPETPKIPKWTLAEASKPEHINKLCQTNIQVTAVTDTTFACPSALILEKYALGDGSDAMQVGDTREWELKANNCKDILHLVDNNFKETTIKDNIRNLTGVLLKEKFIRQTVLKQATIFKAYASDLFETQNTETNQPMEYVCYAINQRLESGKKYAVTYKLVPHPYKGQQLTMIIVRAEEANDSVSNFKITDSVKNNLKLFQAEQGKAKDKLFEITERVKGVLGYNGNNKLIQTIDLTYHTPLMFHMGRFKNIRAYLDTLVIGESRVGKSSTANCLRELYELGTFTSLAGNSATIPGLVGGSNKSNNGFQTRAGIIPQNHKGMIIFEEFGKSNKSVITELTDIRSSNEVRITRVSGTITMPAMVRMLSLTNPKNDKGQIKSIASYPNGIQIVTDLIETAEDIARYDIILILSDKGNTDFNPLWEPLEPYPKEAYMDRIRWVWSRTPEQIVLSNSVIETIMEAASDMNKIYNSHIKIFGTEAWKKLTRIAIAIAGYLCSTDNSFKNIIVTEEHVALAAKYFIELYDNDTFKFKQFVDHERKYTEIDEDGIALLQTIFDKYPMLVMQLEQSAGITKNILGSATGLGTEALNAATNLLAKGLFIKFSNYEMIPTERFRLGVNQINQDTYVERLGEDVTV